VEVFLEKLTVTQLVKKFTAYYRTRNFITVFTRFATGPYGEPHSFSPHIFTLFTSDGF